MRGSSRARASDLVVISVWKGGAMASECGGVRVLGLP